MVGPARVDPVAKTVSGPTGKHELNRRQMSVLCHLAEFAGSPVSRVDLLARSFGRGASDAALDSVIHTLRAALGDLGHPSLLITIPRTGYLLREVRPRDPQPSGPDVRPAGDGSADAPADDGKGLLRELIEKLTQFQARRPRRVLVAVSFTGALFVSAIALLADAVSLFGMSQTMARVGAILVLAAAPLLIAFAWEYRLGADGIERDIGTMPGRAPRKAWPTFTIALVAAVALGFAGWLVAVRGARGTPTALGEDLLTVLPFRTLGPESLPDGFGEGIAEDISHVLNRHRLRVVSYKELTSQQMQLPPSEIGRILGVAQIVNGSVRHEDGVTIISAQLIDASTGEMHYSSRIDDRNGTMVDLPMRVGREVVAALGRELVPEVEASFRVARTDRNEAYVLYYEALALIRGAGDLSRILEAEELLRKALSIDDDFAAAHAQLCRLNLWKYERDRDPAMLQVAERSCEVARRLDPSPDTAKAIAGFYSVSGEFRKAGTLYLSLLEVAPQDAELWVGLADVHTGQQRWADAEQGYRRAVEVEPDRWLAHNSLGRFLWQRRRIEEAAASFEAALQLAPSSAITLNNLGSMWLYEGNFGEAGQAFERVLAIEPVKAAYSNLGTVRFYQGDFTAAESLFREAVKRAGNDWQPRINLAETLWHLPTRRADAFTEYRVAARLLEVELDLVPGAADRQALLALVYSRLGQAAESDRRLAEALRLGADFPDVQLLVATIAADREDWAAATTALQRAVELGYPPALIRSAPDFRPLHGRAEFIRLTDRARAR